MSTKHKGSMYAAFLSLMLAILACTCGPLSDSDSAATAAAFNFAATSFAEQLTFAANAQTQAAPLNAEMTSLARTANAPAPTLPVPPTEAATEESPLTESRQWAENATASSQWSDESGAAIEAAGAPDSEECVDQHSAWATAGRNEVATLTLDYETPVVPTQINIYQTWHPDAVSRVTVIDVDGNPHTVYTGTPNQLPDGSAPCPYVLTIDIDDITIPIAQIVVTIDQTSFNSWNEIDAVELVGTS